MSKIELYAIPGSPRLKLVPAQKARTWMNPHSYRCLPITSANAFGWDIVLPDEVTFHWNGGDKPEDVKIIGDGALNAKSHFGDGTVTFPVGYSWKTEPGVHLMVGPVPNADKIFFHTISAIVETDVLQYPWFLTIRAARKGDTILAPGTVLGRVFPVHLADITDAEIVEMPEPVDFRLAREQHAKDREASVKENPKAWLRFYHEKVTHKSVKAPEVKLHDEGDILVKNNILAVENYLTAEEAKTVADFIAIAPDRPQSLEYWKGRTFDFDHTHFSPELYEKLTKGVHETVTKFYGTTMKMEHPSLVRWSEGDVMRPHSDYSRGIFPDRDYAVVIYLTDDYTGGEIYMPTIGLDIAPKTGSLVAFHGGNLFHGVRRVNSGQRLTCITWLKDTGKL